jgi:hypothetical protein
MSGEPAVNFHGYLRTRWRDFCSCRFPLPHQHNPLASTHSGLILGCRHDNDTMETIRGVTINAREPSQFSEESPSTPTREPSDLRLEWLEMMHSAPRH